MAINIALTFFQRRRLIKKIKDALCEREWNIKDLAEFTGYNESTIYRLLNPRYKASRDCVYEVTRILDINMEDVK